MGRKLALRLAAAALLLVSAPAPAEPRDLRETRSLGYYQARGGLTLAGFAASGGAWLLFKDSRAGARWGSFGPDDLVERNFSGAAAALSDQLLLTTTGAPVALQMAHGLDVSAANATLIYAQAQSLGSLLTMSAKLIARRSRPYTQSRDPRAQAYARGAGSDAAMSFFSGHSSASFVGATAGSILYSARSDQLWLRHASWGVEHTLAGLTAQLRVCAGRHYRTDIWAGAAVGIGVGVLVPWLSDVDLARVRPSEVGVAAGAAALTMGLTEAVNFCGLLRGLGVRDVPRVLTPLEVPGEGASELAPSSKSQPPGVRWFVLPAAQPGAIGLQLVGEL